MKTSPRPHDMGFEQASNGRRISGSGTFAVQVLRSSNAENLPHVVEDKRPRLTAADLYGQGRPKQSNNHHVPYLPRDDVRFRDDNRSLRMGAGEIPYTKKLSGSSHGGGQPTAKRSADYYEDCSVSTIGNGTHFDRESPQKSGTTRNGAGGNGNDEKKGVTFESDVIQDQPWVIKQCPNEAHPLLEFPPAYWLVRNNPDLLKAIKHIYSFRWRMSYPLQRRVYLSQQLKKAGIFCTIGELILVLPLIANFIAGLLFAFVWPSTYWSGHVARLPLILALATAMRNSIVTLLIGLPFERAIWYHKVLGRLAFFNGILHAIVAHADALERTFTKFLVYDQMNGSGTALFLLIALVTITSLPQVRHWCFEVFYYVHVVCVVAMTVCAFYHSGVLIPILASILWGGDLLCRKIIMACFRYPQTARLRIVSDTVLELSFPKTEAFDYNAGQHLSIAVPELVGAGLEFHPFSIATCPRQPNVSIMIRVAGDWTRALHKLAKEKNEISILVEGPNGSPAIDIFSDRYKSFLLFSGGIGITPIQSMTNQLVYELNKGSRELEKIRVVWTERDPVAIEGTDVVRRASTSCHFQVPEVDLEDLDLRSIASHSVFNDGMSHATDIASTLLALIPLSKRTDAELEQDYPLLDGSSQRKTSPRKSANASAKKATDESTFRGAYNNADLREILDMQVYLTSKEANQALHNVPFVHMGRPDIEQIFADQREEALQSGLNRVGVIVCAPARLAHVLQVACVKYSDADLRFDFHMEYQD